MSSEEPRGETLRDQPLTPQVHQDSQACLGAQEPRGDGHEDAGGGGGGTGGLSELMGRGHYWTSSYGFHAVEILREPGFLGVRQQFGV